MKELSIKKKAIAYDEALERAKEVIEYYKEHNRGDEASIEDLESIFPELKESEDDRIRKALIRFHKSTIDIDGIKGDEIVAWLEKQDEQKPTDKVEPKFKVGDFIVNDYCMGRIVEITKDAYLLDTEQGIPFSCHSTRLWDITKDAKDGDVLCTYECYEPKIVFILKGTPKKHYALGYHCYYNIMYPHFESDSEKGCLSPNDEDVKPATKEQRDTLERAMNDAGWEFDFDKKELKKISQRMVSAEAKEAMYDKPTDEEMKELLRTEYEKGRADAIAEMQKGWSEEDECILFRTINDLKFLKDDISIDPKYAINIIDIEREIDWLKSLKDRYTWKPSEEQMEALHDLNLTGNLSYAGQGQVLIELYNDLKKLKG